MATTIASTASPRTAPAAGSWESLFRLGGLGLLISAFCSFLGGVWDIQWHEDVGPDTFFTAPHLLLYAGTTGVGLTSLLVVLICTWRVARGDPSPRGALVPLLRRTFWAPVGFVVSGCGALVFLLFGLYDLWWHAFYGFDAVLDSPPHTGLGLADVMTLSGCVAVFALLVTRSKPTGVWPSWPTAGLAAATALGLLNSATWQIGFDGRIAGAVDGQLLFVAGLHALALLAVASVVRRPGAATLTALIYSVLYAGGRLFSDWATPAYADALGLFPRDNAVGIPQIVALLPRFVLPAAAVIDLGLVFAHRRGASVRGGVMLASGTGMLLLTVLDGVLVRGDVDNALSEVGIVASAVGPLSWGMVAATAAVAAVVGAVAGWAGWKLGVVLRNLSKARPTAAAPAARGERIGAGFGDALKRTAICLAVGASAGAPIALLGGGAAAQDAVQGAAPQGGSEGVAGVEAVDVVHREAIEAGPYRLTVGFTEWPLRAERSLDILFEPEGGVADKRGTLTLIAPSGEEEHLALVRHPRQREAWGLDIVALPEEGRWTARFALDGSRGRGEGSLTAMVGPRPGPPVIVGWLPALAVGGGMVAALVVAWRRVRPARAPETWSWGLGGGG